jgi:hypothetical protein
MPVIGAEVAVLCPAAKSAMAARKRMIVLFIGDQIGRAAPDLQESFAHAADVSG